jgi:hypothetical protein
MTATKIFKNFLLSAVIIVIYILVLFILFYPSQSPLGKSFGIVSLYMLSTYAALILGGLLVLLRLSKVVKDPSSFFYILFANLNFAITATATGLFLAHEAEFSWLRHSFLNLLLGVIMIGDLLIFSLREDN